MCPSWRMSELPLNSRRTLPRPLNQRSSSASRSNVPAVSIEKAWMLLYGNEVKSRFLSCHALDIDCDQALVGEHHEVPNCLEARDDLLAWNHQGRHRSGNVLRLAGIELED